MKSFINPFLLITILFIACNDKSNIKEVEIFKKNTSSIYQTKNDSAPVIYVAVSNMISPMETFNLYKDVMDYISKKIGIHIEFKQRKTYQEVNDLLIDHKLDFAFICTGAYMQLKSKYPIEILAVPVVEGKPYYNAYVIANEESNINNLSDLKGKSFAFTDPLSNTGYEYINQLLKDNGTSPEKFFSKTIFTYAHDYSIQAVKRKIVDGATVDGLVYEYLKHFQPDKVEKIKIVHKSKPFGIPPFVVQKDLNKEIKEKLKKVMLNMHLDAEGRNILNKIMIDKFIEADDSLYK